MTNRIFSNGATMIVTTSAIYIVAVICVLVVTDSVADPNSIEGVNLRFYVSLALGGGVVILAILQFCWNMYITNPIRDIYAGLLIASLAVLTGMILQYLVAQILSV